MFEEISLLIRQIASSLICHNKTDFYQIDFCVCAYNTQTFFLLFDYNSHSKKKDKFLFKISYTIAVFDVTSYFLFSFFFCLKINFPLPSMAKIYNSCSDKEFSLFPFFSYIYLLRKRLLTSYPLPILISFADK